MTAQRATPRFAFLIHPLVPLHRHVLAARRGHLPGALGGDAGIDLVGPGALIRMQTAAGDVEGLVVGIPDLPDRLISDQQRALALEVRGAQAAAAHGAQVIGLANALGVVAGRGAELQRRTALPVTSGQAATAWACGEITREVLRERGNPLGPVGLLGFTGTVGDAVARILAADGVQVFVESVGPAVARRAAEVGVSAVPQDELLARCRVVVGAATTGPYLAPSKLRPNTTLVDLSLPRTLEDGPLPSGFRRVSGESLLVPGRVQAGFWGRLWLFFAGYGRGRVFACFAEPAALAIMGERSGTVGRRLDLPRVAALGATLRHLGFRPKA